MGATTFSKQIILFLVILTIIAGFLFIGNNLGMLLALVLIFGYNYFNYGHLFSQLGLRGKKVSASLVAKSFLIGAGISLFSFILLLPLIETLTGDTINTELFEPIRGNLSNLLVFLLVGWIVGGFIEEIIFRGFLMQRLEDLIPGTTGKVIAFCAPAAFFGFLHGYQGISGQVLVILVGLLMAFIFLRFGRNLWMNIFVHGFINTVSFTVIYFGWDSILSTLFFS